MIWVDFTVEQAGKNFRVAGDWFGEVMGYDKDGNVTDKKGKLYSPGDVFVVNKNGWLVKQEKKEKK